MRIYFTFLESEFDNLQDRGLQTGKGFVYHLTRPAKLFLVQEGVDERYGARQP